MLSDDKFYLILLVYLLMPQIYIDSPWHIGIGKNIMKSLSTFDMFVILTS